jgi:hypothetical protein
MDPLLRAVFPDGRKVHSRQRSMHLDNCRVHRSEASENFSSEDGIVRIPHPAYGPGLRPSDFWIFDHMKCALAGQQFTEPSDLLDDIQVFLDEIQTSQLEYVFHH